MIKHIWSVLCERSILDQDTKLISLINVVEEINIEEKLDQQAELVPFAASLVTMWTRSDINEPTQGFARYSFTSPKGKALQTLEQPIDLEKFERLRARGYFANLPISEPGQYFFYIEVRENEQARWKKVATIPLKVNFKTS